ncbi:DUF1254 domain-containing protein [Xanthobacter sp. DSM 24535]|uniref:DUF1254 domain-containing protein n=1 Tax=Roseixanthobacter psychrophilus TaxID=3119917 RepID=UPI00372770AE
MSRSSLFGRQRPAYRSTSRSPGPAERLAAIFQAVPAAPRLLLLPVVFTLVLAGIVHLLSVLAMPRLAQASAYQRLAPLAPVNTLVLLPQSGETVLPMTDPAFISAVCRYDLRQHPLKVKVPQTGDYTSVSFYTNKGLPFYALNDQAAGRVIELDLLSPAQRAALPEDEEITAADRLIVESPSTTGIVLIRAFARYGDVRDTVRKQLAASSCTSTL